MSVIRESVIRNPRSDNRVCAYIEAAIILHAKESVMKKLILLGFILFASPLKSQEIQLPPEGPIREIVMEKLRIPKERFEQLLKGETQVAGESRHTFGKASTSEVIVSGDPYAESEIHAAINPNDPSNIVVSAIRLNPSNPSETLLCPVYYTRDFGSTWRKSSFRTVPREAGAVVLGGGDPVFAFDADSKLYFSWLNLYIYGPQLLMAMYCVSSTDGGETWTRPTADVIGKGSLTEQNAEGFDKQWLAVDRTNSPYRNHLYAALYNPSQTEMRISLRKKHRDSIAFEQRSIRVSSPGFKFVQFTSIDIDQNGGVHITFFGTKDSITYSMYHTVSTDGGETFSPETKVSDINMPRFSANDRQGGIPGIDNQRVYPSPHLVIDKSNLFTRGYLYLTWAANGISQKDSHGMDIYFIRSTDNGATWSTPFIVNDDPRGLVRDQFHPSIAVNGNGVVTVTWYDRRDDPNNMIAKYTMAQSFDGGRSFGSSTPIATQPMDFARAGLLNGNFTIGEYTQVLMTNDYVIPFWADGRLNTGNLDVYAAFIPVSGTASVERIGTVAEGFQLFENYPNPFNPSTTIRYSIEKGGHVRVVVRTLLGETVRTLVDEEQAPGVFSVSFNGEDLVSGTYYYSLITDFGNVTRTMTLMK